MSNRNEEEFDLSGWGRLVLGVVGVIVGLGMVGAGVQFGDWWFTGADETTNTVSCDYDDEDGYDEDDDDDDVYYPEDGRLVVHFQDESGVWCARTIRSTETYLTTDWPLWLAAPSWVVTLVLLVGLCLGGLVLAFYTVVVVCDRVIRKQFLEWWVRVLAARKR